MATEEMISFTCSTEREWGAYRERQPDEIVTAFQYTGSFPLDFLHPGEVVRVAADAEYSIEVIDGRTRGRLVGVRLGEYIVRWPELGLRNHTAEGFEADFEEVEG